MGGRHQLIGALPERLGRSLLFCLLLRLLHDHQRLTLQSLRLCQPIFDIGACDQIERFLRIGGRGEAPFQFRESLDALRGTRTLIGYIYGGIRAFPREFPYLESSPSYSAGNVPTKPNDMILAVYVTVPAAKPPVKQ